MKNYVLVNKLPFWSDMSTKKRHKKPLQSWVEVFLTLQG